MDPVSVALMRIRMGEIPRELLRLAFMPKRYDPTRQERYQDNVFASDIEHLMRLIVVEGRVSIDVNLISGTEMFLPLSMAEREYVDIWNVIYRFGREATGGRRIVTAHEVTYGQTQTMSGSLGGAFNTQASIALQATRDVLRATTGMQTLSTAYVQIVGVNTLLVNDINQMIGTAMVRCTLGHEPNFNDIKPHYVHAFGEMIVLAVKAYVFNQLVVDMDEGQIKSGMSVGRIREELDKLSDANAMYMEYLTKTWPKLGLMNDTERFKKVMKLALGSKASY